MKWEKTKPTKSGHYWIYTPSYQIPYDLLPICVIGEDVFIHYENRIICTKDFPLEQWFMGPLKKPKPPKD
jgi:hypothetical protein